MAVVKSCLDHVEVSVGQYSFVGLEMVVKLLDFFFFLCFPPFFLELLASDELDEYQVWEEELLEELDEEESSELSGSVGDGGCWRGEGGEVVCCVDGVATWEHNGTWEDG